MSVFSNTLPSGFRSLPLTIAQLSLAAVLQCGQSFRWSLYPLTIESADGTTTTSSTPSHEYRLCLQDRVVCLRQTPEALHYRSFFPLQLGREIDQDLKEAETLAWINDYFQLKIDLRCLYEQWGIRDPVFLKLKDRFSGIRMLRQDPFECLISFICSSNNNISRITKMVKALCKEYSPVLIALEPPSDSASNGLEVEHHHPFPPPSALAGPDVSTKLRSLGFGYRAEFIQKTAKMLVDAHGSIPLAGSVIEPSEMWLRSLRDMDTTTARSELLKLMGVGRKVADCILLMSLDKPGVVPVDTHVHQIAVKHYGMSGSKAKTNMTPALYEQVNTKLVSVWGDYAGWAHSVLFTSDLRAFSSYGLPTSTLSSPSPTKLPTLAASGRPVSQTTMVVASPSPSPRKRKVTRPSGSASGDSISLPIDSPHESPADWDGSDLSMVDRVKRRRRGNAAK